MWRMTLPSPETTPTPFTAPTGPGSAQPSSRSTLGVISFVTAVVNVLVGAGLSLAISATVLSSAGSDYQALAVIQIVQSVLTVLLALTSVITGLVVLLKPGVAKGFAAAGTALGGAALFGVLTGLAQNLVFQFL
jgi:hypothetical protein